MRFDLLNLIALMGLVAGGCARDNPMFEMDSEGAAGSRGSDAGKDGNDDNNADSNPATGDGNRDSDSNGDDNDTTPVDDGNTTGGADSGDGGDDNQTDGHLDTGEPVEECKQSTGDQAFPSIADTFVASDGGGPFCGDAACETQNFGASQGMWVTSDFDGREVHLLARFQLSELALTTVTSAELEVSVGDGKGNGFSDVTLLVSALDDQQWAEGNGGGDGSDPVVATEGESSWYWRASPESWGDQDSFDDIVGDQLGQSWDNAVPGGTVLAIPIEIDGLVPLDEGPYAGTYSLSVTRIESANQIPLMTREWEQDAIVLRLYGCQ